MKTFAKNNKIRTILIFALLVSHFAFSDAILKNHNLVIFCNLTNGSTNVQGPEVMWNFYEVEENIEGKNILRATSAPAVTLDGYELIDSGVFVNNVAVRNQIHLPVFDGDIQVVPSPAAIISASLGSILVAVIRRKRGLLGDG